MQQMTQFAGIPVEELLKFSASIEKGWPIDRPLSIVTIQIKSGRKVYEAEFMTSAKLVEQVKKELQGVFNNAVNSK